ncbi:MAG: hypothetical protein HZB42_12330 [Sphingobacteriales bacterium]|nr:hypothetical protein [Sphingobacteriales bacterium]
MSPFATGAIIGGVVGLVTIVITYFNKEQKFNKILRSIKEPMEYVAAYHYASFKRYKNSFKFFDSMGALYIIGKIVYYKSSETAVPLDFNMEVCSVQQEPDWRMLKWLSITTPAGEKFYFNSHKMGLFKNDSSETLKGLAVIKTKMAI